jgi:DNA-binding NarL/FixJ family response regulator
VIWGFTLGDCIRVLLVDNHTILREGLKRLLELHGDIEVSWMASTAEEALGLGLEELDLAVIEISLPGENGIWLVRQLRAQFSSLPILMLTMHTDTKSVMEALEAGADGYLTKAVEQQEMLRAIRSLVNGGSHIQARLAPQVIRSLRHKKSRSEPEPSDRDVEIIKLLVEGRSNSEIAKQICLSVSTVKANLRTLYQKLGVSNRTEAVAVVIQRGLVPYDMSFEKQPRR